MGETPDPFRIMKYFTSANSPQHLRLILVTVTSVVLVACGSYNIKETGITSQQAESIAKSSSDNLREGYTKVDRSDWIRKSHSWVVSLVDKSEDHGRVYKIDMTGQIIGTKVIDQNPEDDNYWPDSQPAPQGEVKKGARR